MSGDNFKAPSQVFRWFEKMKSNYEQTVNTVLNRFELYNEKQQARIDTANSLHIDSLKATHAEQIAQQQQTIAQLHQDISYYKQQISQQQHSIEQLNARYDAVMSTFLQQKKRDIDIKAIFDDEEDTVENIATDISSTVDALEIDTSLTNLTNNSEDTAIEIDEDLASKLYQDAITYRDKSKHQDAISLFKQAAKMGCLKSRGAIGRAYFLAEGVEEDQTLGLAWLMTAADKGLPQAIKRVAHFKETDPELFLAAELKKDAVN